MIIVDELTASSLLQFHQAASQLRERLQRECATPPTAQRERATPPTATCK